MGTHMKIVTIVGARPQFIKASVLSREFRKHRSIKEIILHTGQHFDPDMSDVFFREMGIPKPKYNLNIDSLSHGVMTGKMLVGIEKILLKEQPDYVLVYGDTNSTLAGALAAQKLHIKVIHVEAGLRSRNMQMPEEINRLLTDKISDLLFCPTAEAVKNLRKEGVESSGQKIILSGDVMLDAALFYGKTASKRSTILSRFGLKAGKYLLCTLHRAENTEGSGNLGKIIHVLNHLSREYRIVLPLHPRTKKILALRKMPLKFEPIKPVGYLDMLNLLKHTKMVLTDSGGLQKEAYFFDKYCVTMRDETEWVELVKNGVNVITGADPAKIIHAVKRFSGKPFPKKQNLYGNGHACARICRAILKQND